MSNIGFLWSPTKAMDIVSAMGTQHSNLEIVARDICARQIAHSCETPDELRRSVDRYWHIVAAQLEAGMIDESGRDLEPFDNDRRLASLRDWRARNPDHEVPPLRPSRGA